MLQYILAIAGTIAQAAKYFHKLMVQSVNAGFKNCLFPCLANLYINFLARLFHHFFNACRMDSAIHDELFKRDARYFAANRVKPRKDDSLGRIVDNEIDTGCGLKCTDVAALTPNDAAFHFIVWKRNNGNCSFRHMIGSAALNGHGNDVACTLIRFFLGLCFNIADHQRRFVAGITLHIAQKDFPCLVHRHSGNGFKLLKLAVMQILNGSFEILYLFLLPVQRLFPLFNAVNFLIQCFLALNQSALSALQFVAPVAVFLFVFALDSVNLFLCFQNGLFFYAFCAFLRIINHLLDGVLRLCNLGFRDISTIAVSAKTARSQTSHPNCNGDYNVVHRQTSTSKCI